MVDEVSRIARFPSVTTGKAEEYEDEFDKTDRLRRTASELNSAIAIRKKFSGGN
jgi:hypothetical protein